MSDMAGKAARVAVSERAASEGNGATGMSDMAGKAARVAVRERAASEANGATGMSDMAGKAARVPRSNASGKLRRCQTLNPQPSTNPAT